MNEKLGEKEARFLEKATQSLLATEDRIEALPIRDFLKELQNRTI